MKKIIVLLIVLCAFSCYRVPMREQEASFKRQIDEYFAILNQNAGEAMNNFLGWVEKPLSAKIVPHADIYSIYIYDSDAVIGESVICNNKKLEIKDECGVKNPFVYYIPDKDIYKGTCAECKKDLKLAEDPKSAKKALVISKEGDKLRASVWYLRHLISWDNTDNPEDIKKGNVNKIATYLAEVVFEFNAGRIQPVSSPSERLLSR